MSFNRKTITPIRDFRNNVVQYCEDPNGAGFANSIPQGRYVNCDVPEWANYVVVKTTANGLYFSQTTEIDSAPVGNLQQGDPMTPNTDGYTLCNQRDDDVWHALLPETTKLYFFASNGGSLTVDFFAGPEMNSEPAPESAGS